MKIIEIIKDFFARLFNINRVKRLGEAQIIIDELDNIEEVQEAQSNEFLDSLKIPSNSYVINLEKKIISNEVKIEALSDKQLDDMIDYYKNKLGIEAN